MREKRTYRKQFVLSKSTARKLKVVSQMLGTSQNEIIDRAIVSYADQQHFKTLQKNADEVIQCPFYKVIPWGFTVSGTKKEHENE